MDMPLNDERKNMDEILCKVLTYLPGASTHYDPEVVVCSLGPPRKLSIPNNLFRACPAVSVENLLKFSLVSYAKKLEYEQKYSPITMLSKEILDLVLKQLSPQSGELVKPSERASLSVESFARRTPLPLVRDSADVNHFSRTCHKFLELGQRRLFVRVSVRFSSEGFHKLQNIAERPLLASSVKKFSYMIPRFYSQDRAQFEDLLQNFSRSSQSSFIGQIGRERNQQQQRDPRRVARDHARIKSTMIKAEDQRSVIQHSRDRDCLLYALSSFRGLQQVRLMKVDDPVDRGWTAFLDRYPEHRATFQPDEWARSCEHAAKTLAWVLHRSNNELLDRFSSRFMEPSSPLVMTPSLQMSISTLAERLLYLELEFVDERSHQHERMSELSEVFGAVFTAAVNLKCLHVGFRWRTSAPLFLLFNNVRISKLIHLGLHMWDLDSDELIELLRRHSALRSIRLRHISLKQVSNEKNWEKVLRYIKGSYPNLKWISLRGISYDARTNATTHAMGGLHFAPALQPHPLQVFSETDSDSSISISNWSPEGNHDNETRDDHESSDPESAASEDDTDELSSSEPGSDNYYDENDSDLEEEHHDLSFEPSISAENTLLTTSDFQPQPERGSYNNIGGPNCECGNGSGSYDLGDDGKMVTKDQWQRWEKWVEGFCPKHNP